MNSHSSRLLAISLVAVLGAALFLTSGGSGQGHGILASVGEVSVANASGVANRRSPLTWPVTRPGKSSAAPSRKALPRPPQRPRTPRRPLQPPWTACRGSHGRNGTQVVAHDTLHRPRSRLPMRGAIFRWHATTGIVNGGEHGQIRYRPAPVRARRGLGQPARGLEVGPLRRRRLPTRRTTCTCSRAPSTRTWSSTRRAS